MAEGDIIITNPEQQYDACLAVLADQGWKVKFKKWAWQTWKGNVAILAQSPLELLGAVALFNARGENWQTRPDERHLAANMVGAGVERPIIRRSKVKVMKPLPWLCGTCKSRSMSIMQVVKDDCCQQPELRVRCQCGNEVICGDAAGDFEVLAHTSDFFILRYSGEGNKTDHLFKDEPA